MIAEWITRQVPVTELAEDCRVIYEVTRQPSVKISNSL